MAAKKIKYRVWQGRKSWTVLKFTSWKVALGYIQYMLRSGITVTVAKEPPIGR